ncbi:MAG: hypothetical protein R6U98_36635 [Pirellulaceae bacterium]
MSIASLLELRVEDGKPTAPQLQWIGRGPRLLAPIRLQALVDEKWIDAEVVEAPEPALRDGAAACQSKQTVGSYTVTLTASYRADGAGFCLSVVM